MELDNLEARLVERYGRSRITPRNVLSAALYPKVFEEYQSHVLRYSDLIEKLPTRAFLLPLKEDEEVEIELSKVRRQCARVCMCVCACACERALWCALTDHCIVCHTPAWRHAGTAALLPC